MGRTWGVDGTDPGRGTARPLPRHPRRRRPARAAGERPGGAARVRRDATAAYSRAWDDRARRRLETLLREAERPDGHGRASAASVAATVRSLTAPSPPVATWTADRPDRPRDGPRGRRLRPMPDPDPRRRPDRRPRRLRRADRARRGRRGRVDLRQRPDRRLARASRGGPGRAWRRSALGPGRRDRARAARREIGADRRSAPRHRLAVDLPAGRAARPRARRREVPGRGPRRPRGRLRRASRPSRSSPGRRRCWPTRPRPSGSSPAP